MWEIKSYRPSMEEEWDAFVANSRNSTFLFSRAFMDYHKCRFVDFSLMAYRNGKLSALLPANLEGDKLISHQGLTYGGWILPSKGIDAGDFSLLWKTWLQECDNKGIRTIIYKPLPYIFASQPSQEDLYALFLSDARLSATNISTTLDLRKNPGFDKLQCRHLKKALPDFYGHIITAETPEYVKSFHEMLSDCLQNRHNTRPVHTAEELQLLMTRFPGRIVIWSAYSDSAEGMLAGVCVFVTKECVHCQYIATSPKGREMNMLTPLFEEMIRHYSKEGYRYFDFGTSNEEGGRFLNCGLNRQKTSYGGTGVAYQCYEINVSCALKSLSSGKWLQE